MTPLSELIAPLAEAANRTFHIIPAEAEVWVQADRNALLEILNNLIDNALKYAPAGTHIWLQWGLLRPHQPQMTGILIGDTGPGIPVLDQVHIFERHFRGVQAHGQLAGSGLGLAIAHDLMREMHGDIELYSPLSELPWPLPPPITDLHPPAGTAFIVWLPKTPPADG